MEKDTNSKGGQKVPFVPLDALIKKQRIVFFDTTALGCKGIQQFINFNKDKAKDKSVLFVPEFIYTSLDESSRKPVNFMLAYKMMNKAKAESYQAILSSLKTKGVAEDAICLVCNDMTVMKEVFETAKNLGLSLQTFRIGENGALYHQFVPSNDLQNDRRNNRPNDRQNDRQNNRPNNHQNNRPNDRQNTPRRNDQHPQKRNFIAEKFQICLTPERMTVRPLGTESLTRGSIVTDSRNNKHTLGEVVYTHSNALTYATENPKIRVKIYNPGVASTFLEEKVRRMLTRDIHRRGLCWPIDMVYDSNGTFAGYLVPKSEGEPLHLTVFKQTILKQRFASWTKLDLCALAMTILQTIKYLHENNILLGCINPAAIRIVDKDTVYFIETDNYQIEGFPTFIYNTTFTPPELLGRKIYLCSKENENYAVALLLFMIMMPGKLPYTYDGSMSMDDAIRSGKFSFKSTNSVNESCLPGSWRKMWSHLIPFRDLFYTTFQKGAQRYAPEQRRQVDDWIGTLFYYMKQLQNPEDPESLKLFPEAFLRDRHATYYRCDVCGKEHPHYHYMPRYLRFAHICNDCMGKRSNVNFVCQACGKTYYYTNEASLFHISMKAKDADWRDQRYCSDCKEKTLVCPMCHREVPFYTITRAGSCRSCYSNAIYATRTCRNCGNTFTITNGEHDYLAQKHLSDPTKCKNCRGNKQ